jgi:hypothetical protein
LVKSWAIPFPARFSYGADVDGKWLAHYNQGGIGFDKAVGHSFSNSVQLQARREWEMASLLPPVLCWIW